MSLMTFLRKKFMMEIKNFRKKNLRFCRKRFCKPGKNEVKYGGTYLHAIHFNDKQQSTWISFLCKNYCVPTSRDATIQFTGNQSNTTSANTQLGANKARRSLKQYFKPEDSDYGTLVKLLNDPNAWESVKLKEAKVNVRPEPERRRVMMEELFKTRIKVNKRISDWFDLK